MSISRVIFMGTPEFAVPALKTLAARDDVDLALVVTQPDRPAGRGNRLTAPPVKDAAEALGLPLLQVPSLRGPETKQRIIALRPDLVVVAAFGMILGKWILELPTRGCVNLHASLLPKYRGASPISAAILAGESVTGVTLMQMDRGLDTGDIIAAVRVPILPTDTTASLTPKLADAGAHLLAEQLADVLAGRATRIPQPFGATETRQLTKDDGRIDWTQSAVAIERQIRAMWDWPRAWTLLPDGTRLQIHAAEVTAAADLAPGACRVLGHQVVVGTSSGSLQLNRIQLPGKSAVAAPTVAQVLHDADGATFS